MSDHTMARGHRSPTRQAADAGFTLLEIMVALLVLSMIVTSAFGTLRLGQGDTASNGTSEVDLSGTDVAAYSSVADVGGSFEFRDGSDKTGITVGGSLLLAGREIQPSGIPKLIQGIILFCLISSEILLRYGTYGIFTKAPFWFQRLFAGSMPLVN